MSTTYGSASLPENLFPEFCCLAVNSAFAEGLVTLVCMEYTASGLYKGQTRCKNHGEWTSPLRDVYSHGEIGYMLGCHLMNGVCVQHAEPRQHRQL